MTPKNIEIDDENKTYLRSYIEGSTDMYHFMKSVFRSFLGDFEPDATVSEALVKFDEEFVGEVEVDEQ